jgi:hypothetical protein
MRPGRVLPVLTVVTAAFALAGCQTLFHRAKPTPPTLEPPPPASVPRPPPAPPPPRAAPTPPPQTILKSCIPKSLAAPPRYPDTDAALRNSAGAADRYQLMAAGRILREQRLEELERVISGCR